jgi:hypothetical protein
VSSLSTNSRSMVHPAVPCPVLCPLLGRWATYDVCVFVCLCACVCKAMNKMLASVCLFLCKSSPGSSRTVAH